MDSFTLRPDLKIAELEELSEMAQELATSAYNNQARFQALKRAKLKIDCEIGRRRAEPVAVSDFPPALSHLPPMNDSTAIADFWDQMLQGLTTLKSKPQPTTPYVCLTNYATGEVLYCDFATDPPLLIKTIKAPDYHYTHIKTAHAEHNVKETADEVLLATGRGSFKPAPRWTAKVAR